MNAWSTKVDKKDFKEHCDENREEFKNIQNNQTLQLKETNALLTELVKQQSAMSRDIEWIKDKL